MISKHEPMLPREKKKRESGVKDDAARVVTYQRVCMILRFGCHATPAFYPILIICLDNEPTTLVIDNTNNGSCIAH